MMILKARNLFLLLATLAGVASIYLKLLKPSAFMAQQSHLSYVFVCIMGVMTAISLIYLVLEKVKRPISSKIGMTHFFIAALAVICGVICTSTAHDGIDNAAWTIVPSFLSVKLFVASMALFLFAIVRALAAGSHRIKLK